MTLRQVRVACVVRVVVGAIVTACACVVVPAVAGAAAVADEWDPRVERFVRFVERTRRLEFAHPVPVRFLTDARFRDATAAWSDDLTTEDRELAALESDDLLALGLVAEPVDLLAAEATADAEGTLGFYDDATGEIVVRGTDLSDLEVRLTLVHELVHALQDQRFDLAALDERSVTSGEITALSALVEGDATLVEWEYLWSRPQREQDAYWDQTDAIPPTGAADDAPDWPLVLDLWSALDYDLAPTALDVLVEAHGRRAVDDLFRAPPTSEEQMIDPVALEQRDVPAPVALPPFAATETPKGPVDEWGAYSWYLVLASRIPWQAALDAVDGWGGDQYASYTVAAGTGATPCVRLAVTGDTPRDTDELERAIAAWSSAMPTGAAEATRDGDVVVLSACATPTAPPSPDRAMQRAYDRLWERTDQMWFGVDRETPPTEYTRCVAGALVADPRVHPLLYLERDLTDAENRRYSERLALAGEECR